jgi:hypothetical protein
MYDTQTGKLVRGEWLYFPNNFHAESWCEDSNAYDLSFYRYEVNWERTNAIDPIDMAD